MLAAAHGFSAERRSPHAFCGFRPSADGTRRLRCGGLVWPVEPLLLERQVGSVSELMKAFPYIRLGCEIFEPLFVYRVRFKKFNDHVLRRILLRDNRAESSIVALYKKLELQNAIELLDTPMGDLSAAPSIVSLEYVPAETCDLNQFFPGLPLIGCFCPLV